MTRHVSWKDGCYKDGERADIKQYLDEDKIAEEGCDDGLYAVCTDLLDDEVDDILKVRKADGRSKNASGS